MNEDWMTELEPRAGEELERHLDRFARLRLDPSPGQAKRARGTVMEAAWRQKLEGRAGGHATVAADALLEPSVTAAGLIVLPAPRVAAARADRALFGGWGPRRLGVSFAAAILAGLMIGSSVFAGSRAGGPLYEARLGLEELALPADSQARVEAELALAQGRLADLVDAAAKGDQRAVTASLAAYLVALDDLGRSTGGPADRALVAIQQHRAVLERILGQVPAQARSGIENALATSGKVIERLEAAGTPAPTGGGATGGTPGGGTGAGAGAGTGAGAGAGAGGGANTGSGAHNGGGGAGANPNAGSGATNGGGAKPEPTPKPARTPKPAKTAAPAATDRPTPKSAQGGKP